VNLIAGRTVKIAGGERLYWRILFMGRTAGHVSITCVRGSDGVDASIDVQLNQESRGRGIGTIAFRVACEMSGLDEVAASIRKSNIASRVAAERAGFRLLEDDSEILMVWRRE
jgi:RimJ/RimL family protein N-acetyltransferase